MSKLTAVGFWSGGGDENSKYPDPKTLVRPGWKRNRSKIVAYLRAGAPLAQWYGFSFCRFDCNEARDDMGTADLTDGVWAWPEGLCHYIEVHGVVLPETFVLHMERHEWSPGSSIRSTGRPIPDEKSGELDFTFWLDWINCLQKKGQILGDSK